MSLPESITDIESDVLLPDEVTELPQEDIEAKPYLLSFQRYNKKMCQIDKGGLDKKQTKNALAMIKSIGTQFCCEDDLSKLGVTVKSIGRGGDYTSLFRRLHDDVELKEAYLSDSTGEKGRLFFYTIDSEKVFYFVAIRGTHISTD